MQFRQTIVRLLIAASFSAAGTTYAAAELVVVSWGGSYVESQINAYGTSWESKAGEKIQWLEYLGGLDEIRGQESSGKIEWDVLDVFAHDALLGCKTGLFENLPDEFFADLDADLLVTRPNDCVAPNNIWSWVTVYDAVRFSGNEPQSIADFFDLEAFPGKRAISAFPQANLEMALVADGVQPEDVYDVLDTEDGLDRAFAKLSTLQGNLTFWSSGEESIEMITRGEVAMSTAYSGRAAFAQLSGATILKTIWDGQVLDVEWYVLVKNAPNRELALDFLQYVSQPLEQALLSKWIPYGPMRRSSLELIAQNEPWFNTGQNILQLLPNRPDVMARSIISDPSWWAKNSESVTERFATWRENLGL